MPCASTTLQNHQRVPRMADVTLLTAHRALDCRCVHQSKICQSSDPRSCSGSVGEKGGCLKFDIYKNLLRINAGYKEVIRGLARLRKQRAFPRGELDRFSALSKENRAATNSFLLSAMETAETEDAGQRFCKRLAKERADEQGN